MKNCFTKCIKYFTVFIIILLVFQESGFSANLGTEAIKVKGIRARVTDIISEKKGLSACRVNYNRR